MAEEATPIYDPIPRLTRDLRQSARTMEEREARWLVDLYYTIQNYRIRSANQVRAMGEGEEPHALVAWSFETFDRVEANIKAAMKEYAKSSEAGEWALSIHGIGPVIAGGLLAHLSVNPWRCSETEVKKRCNPEEPHEGCGRRRINTAGAFWRFAGLDPTLRWGKGEKRPYNARLKVLCWKIGDSFVKQRGSVKDFYGKFYEQRKALEEARNARGDFADQAVATLEAKKIRDKATRDTYEAGRLPQGRLDLRARRYAVKLFLAHFHHVMFESTFGEPPPKPYIIEHGGHAHYIGPPNWR